MFIQTETTPNPATLKFLPGQTVMDSGTADFPSIETAGPSPLAQRIYAAGGVSGVFFGPDFVTVTKGEDENWDHIKPGILGAIMEHFQSGQPVIEGEGSKVDHAVHDGPDSGIVDQIKELLDTRVRPAVAQDGGDITFHGFDKGVVYLHMQGACAGCPSSTLTLKMGIENLLRHYIPEVVEVRPVAAKTLLMQPKGGLDPNILAFDTSLAEVSVSVRSDVILADRREPMARGQAERLFGAIEDVLDDANGSFANLDAIAVGVGPGNFTGIRISVAAARGLALSLGIPAIGVSSFEAMLDPSGPLAEPAMVISLPAPRGQAYVQATRYGVPVGSPHLIDPLEQQSALDPAVNMIVRGHRAEEIAQPFGARFYEASPAHLSVQLSAIAEIKLRETGFDPNLRPAPLYVRAPDAAPPKISPPPILS